MILAAFILIGIGMRLQTFDFIESKDHDPLSVWGIRSAKIDEPRIKSRLPKEKHVFHCSDLHRTDEAPFTALILLRGSGRLLCLGAILDRNHIISVSRCVDKAKINELRVLVGYYKPWWGEHAQILQVSKIIKHDYEIAIVKVKKKFKFTQYVKSASLAPPPTGEKTFEATYPGPFQVVGFFVGEFERPGSFMSKENTYTIKEDKLLDKSLCKENYTDMDIDVNRTLCISGDAQYCWGGLGSPVLVQNMLLGIVFGYGCTSQTTSPFAAARIDTFIDWIHRNSHFGT